MKFLKLAALFMIATVPLLLVRKDKEEELRTATEVDSDHLFDEELSID